MDQVTQQNAALVEEVAAAAGSLRELAQTLVTSTRAFTLKDQARGFGAAALTAVHRSAASPAHARASRDGKPLAPARPASAPKSKTRAVATAGDDEWQTF
jgi:hypothetical protein